MTSHGAKRWGGEKKRSNANKGRHLRVSPNQAWPRPPHPCPAAPSVALGTCTPPPQKKPKKTNAALFQKPVALLDVHTSLTESQSNIEGVGCGVLSHGLVVVGEGLLPASARCGVDRRVLRGSTNAKDRRMNSEGIIPIEIL